MIVSTTMTKFLKSLSSFMDILKPRFQYNDWKNYNAYNPPPICNLL
jgi:hypothetical protein